MYNEAPKYVSMNKISVIDIALIFKRMVLHASSNDNRDKNSKTQDKQYNEAGHSDESIDTTHELSRRGNKFRTFCTYIQSTRKKIITALYRANKF